MEWLTLAWKFRNEIGVALLAITVALIVMDIRHTYSENEARAAQISALEKGLENAQKAVKLQADIQLSHGSIDKATQGRISSVLHKPVPRVLVSHGVLGK